MSSEEIQQRSVMPYLLWAGWALACSGMLWLVLTLPHQLKKPATTFVAPAQLREEGHSDSHSQGNLELECDAPTWFQVAHGIHAVHLKTEQHQSDLRPDASRKKLARVAMLLDGSPPEYLEVSPDAFIISPATACASIKFLQVTASRSFMTIDSLPKNKQSTQMAWVVDGRNGNVRSASRAVPNYSHLQQSSERPSEGGQCISDTQRRTRTKARKHDVWCSIDGTFSLQVTWFSWIQDGEEFQYRCNRIGAEGRVEDTLASSDHVPPEALLAMEHACHVWGRYRNAI